MMQNKLQPSSLIASNGSIQTYLRNGLNLNTQGVEEFVVLDATNVQSPAAYTWKLADLGINFKPLSLFAYYFDTPQGTINFSIDIDFAIIIARFDIDGVEASKGFTFPPLLAPSNYLINISPSYPIGRLVIIGQSVGNIDFHQPTFINT